MEETTYSVFMQSLIKSINALPTGEKHVEIAKEQLIQFLMDALMDDKPSQRNFNLTPDILEGIEEGDVFVSMMLNYITMTKKEAPDPLTLKQFLTRNSEIINFEARRK